MELTLKVVSGKHAGQKLRIPAPKFLIGRGEDCHLRPNSDLVSRHHCILFVGVSGAAVRDLNSRNGTFVNEERIVGDRPLRSGDRLTIGQLKFEVRLQTSEAVVPRGEGLNEPVISAATKPSATDHSAAKPPAPTSVPADRAVAASSPAQPGSIGQQGSIQRGGADILGEDDDVIEWFKQQGVGGSTHDTVRIDAMETTTIVAEKGVVDQPGANVLDEEKSSSKIKKASASGVHRQQTKDTREAATQVLKQLFKGR